MTKEQLKLSTKLSIKISLSATSSASVLKDEGYHVIADDSTDAVSHDKYTIHTHSLRLPYLVSSEAKSAEAATEWSC